MSTAKLKTLMPITPAGEDVDVVIAFYEKELDFQLQYKMGEPTNMAIIRRDEVMLMLQRNADKHLADNTAFRIQVSPVVALYEECVAKGGRALHPNGKLHDTPWGSKEFAIIDPAGICITFYEFV